MFGKTYQKMHFSEPSCFFIAIRPGNENMTSSKVCQLL